MQVKLFENYALPTIFDFENVLRSEKIKLIFDILRDLKPDEMKGRHGCFLSMYDKTSNQLLSRFFGDIGLLSLEKLMKYLHCATEKVTRMARYRLETSFEMSNAEKEMFGGGISVNGNLFIGTSGFTPKIDECISYMVAILKLRDRTEEVGSIICQKTGNNTLIELYQTFDQLEVVS